MKISRHFIILLKLFHTLLNFNQKHNPDAKDLKQLSIETGLSKRVLQVWFQNARAKHRRSTRPPTQNIDSEEGSNNNNLHVFDEKSDKSNRSNEEINNLVESSEGQVFSNQNSGLDVV